MHWNCKTAHAEVFRSSRNVLIKDKITYHTVCYHMNVKLCSVSFQTRRSIVFECLLNLTQCIFEKLQKCNSCHIGLRQTLAFLSFEYLQQSDTCRM